MFVSYPFCIIISRFWDIGSVEDSVLSNYLLRPDFVLKKFTSQLYDLNFSPVALHLRRISSTYPGQLDGNWKKLVEYVCVCESIPLFCHPMMIVHEYQCHIRMLFISSIFLFFLWKTWENLSQLILLNEWQFPIAKPLGIFSEYITNSHSRNTNVFSFFLLSK